MTYGELCECWVADVFPECILHELKQLTHETCEVLVCGRVCLHVLKNATNQNIIITNEAIHFKYYDISSAKTGIKCNLIKIRSSIPIIENNKLHV